MPYYQLYHYAPGRRFEYADRFDVPDDEAALARARVKASGHDMELWCGHRRVRIFDLATQEEGGEG